MLKLLAQTIIRKYKNPTFTFDKSFSTWDFNEFLLGKAIELLRSLKLLLNLKFPIFVFVGSKVKFSYLSHIIIGKWVILEDFVYLNGLGKNKLILGNGSRIGACSRLIVSFSFTNLGEYIHIGKNVSIGCFSSIGGSGGVSIGDNTIIGQYFSAHPENHIIENKEMLIKDQGTIRKPILIGSNCWFGSKVTVLSGVTIGDNCVIGAGSVVTHTIEPNSIAVGIPAKIIGKR